jgi:integrase
MFSRIRRYMRRNTDTQLVIDTWLNAQAHTTQLKFAGVLRDWRSFLDCVDVCDATDIHARAFLAQEAKKLNRSGERVARGSVHTKGVILRLLYTELVESDLVDRNPWRRIDLDGRPDGTRRPHRALSDEEVRKLLDVQLGEPGTEFYCVNRCLVALIFALGLRRSEASTLRVDDVLIPPVERANGARNTIRIRLRTTKNRKSYVMPLPVWAEEPLFELLKHRPSPTEPLLGISTSALHHRWHKILKAAGVDFATMHSARKTAITKLIRDGVPHWKVREFSRHSSVAMVERYEQIALAESDHPALKLKF